MRSWWSSERLSRKCVQKKNSPGPAAGVYRGFVSLQRSPWVKLCKIDWCVDIEVSIYKSGCSLPRSPWCGCLSIHAQHWWWQRNCKMLIMYVPYLCTRWKLEGFNRACNRNCAISRLRTNAAWSRDCTLVPRNLEIGTQFPDSENELRNFEIAQIPRLRGTYPLRLLCDVRDTRLSPSLIFAVIVQGKTWLTV